MIPMAAWCVLLYKKDNDSESSVWRGGIVTKIELAVQDGCSLYRQSHL